MKNLNAPRNICLLITLLLLVSVCAGAAEAPLENISARASAALIEKHRADPGFILLDIRTPAEFKAGHIAGAAMLNFYDQSFGRDFSQLDRNQTYLIYCRSGNRSGQLMKAIRGMGFKKIYHMERGLVDWVGQGYKLVKTQPE